MKSNIIEAGDTFRALWGTGYESGQAFVEILQNGKILKKYWTSPGKLRALLNIQFLTALEAASPSSPLQSE